MTYLRSRSPLVIRSGKTRSSVCSFSFYVTEGGVQREKLAANAYSTDVVQAFILRWQQEGGQIIDLRQSESISAFRTSVRSSQSRSLRVRHRSNLSAYEPKRTPASTFALANG